jgi:hypothetical protein
MTDHTPDYGTYISRLSFTPEDIRDHYAGCQTEPFPQDDETLRDAVDIVLGRDSTWEWFDRIMADIIDTAREIAANQCRVPCPCGMDYAGAPGHDSVTR